MQSFTLKMAKYLFELHKIIYIVLRQQHRKCNNNICIADKLNYASTLVHLLSPSILSYMLWKNAERRSHTGHLLLTQDAQPHKRTFLYRCCAYILISYPTSNTNRQRGYLDDLDAEGVIVRVAALVKSKAERFLPVDRDAVDVLVC